jgi:hypothetical protein
MLHLADYNDSLAWLNDRVYPYLQLSDLASAHQILCRQTIRELSASAGLLQGILIPCLTFKEDRSNSNQGLISKSNFTIRNCRPQAELNG